MNLHLLIVIFVLVWLGGVGSAAVAVLVHGTPSEALIPAGMCVFLALITLLGFYPEAIKAQRILEKRLRNTTA
jgi:membrane protein YdbS with pleckstrin-like domain